MISSPRPNLELCLDRIIAALGLDRLRSRKKAQSTSYPLEKDLGMESEELRASHCGGLTRVPEIVIIPPTPKRQPRTGELSLPPHPTKMSFAQRMGRAGLERPKSTLSSIHSQSSRNGFVLADGFLAEEERREFDEFFESTPGFRGLKPRPSPLMPEGPLEMPSEVPTDWFLNVPFGAPFTGKPMPSEPRHFARLSIQMGTEQPHENKRCIRKSMGEHALRQVMVKNNPSNRSPLSMTATHSTETTSTLIGAPEFQSGLESEKNRTRRDFADDQLMRITQLAEDFGQNPIIWRGMNQVNGNLPVEDPVAMIRASMLAMLCRVETTEGKRPWTRALSADPYVEEWREEARQHGCGPLRVVN